MSKRNTNKTSSTVQSMQSFFSSKIAVLAVILVCIIFGIFFLYMPAKDCYHASRNHDKAVAQYNALKQTNENLQNEIEFLQTEEGIKQRASETLGLVESGLSTGIVSGLNNENDLNSTFSTASDKLAYKQIEAPATWYSPLLDKIFDYS